MTLKPECVWDYPRPPVVETVTDPISVWVGDIELARTERAYRVLETSHPPTYYLPPDDIRMEFLNPSKRASHCEWKGRARYYDIVLAEIRVADAAWSYPSPTPAFQQLIDHVAFYPSKVTKCTVAGEVVLAQAGDFYGGWVTSNLTGPFKGGPGTLGW